MSEVTTPPSGGAVVNWQDRARELARAQVEQEASVQTGRFISFAGGQMTYNGEDIEGNELSCVVLDAVLENAYYPGAYDPDNRQPPVCFSFGRDAKTMVPHPDSVAPQHTDCETCKWNKFETADTGGGKACKNIRRLILLPEDSLAHAPTSREGVLHCDAALAKLPVTSVKAWASYIRSVSVLSQKPVTHVVTKIVEKPDKKTTFKLSFHHEGDIESPVLLEALLMRREAEQDTLLAPYSAGHDAEDEGPAQQTAAPAPAEKPKRKY